MRYNYSRTEKIERQSSAFAKSIGRKWNAAAVNPDPFVIIDYGTGAGQQMWCPQAREQVQLQKRLVTNVGPVSCTT